MIATYAPTVTHDASGEATFTYTDNTGALHTVFFQDSTALTAKLQLLRANHPSIGGIAIWVMGGEDPTFWDDIKTQLGIEPDGHIAAASAATTGRPSRPHREHAIKWATRR